MEETQVEKAKRLTEEIQKELNKYKHPVKVLKFPETKIIVKK